MEWLRSSNPIRLWDEDSSFLSLFSKIESHTLVDKKRAYQIYQLAGQAQHIDGDMAEVGVYRGGTAMLISMVAKHRPLHIFDTFEGMPGTGEHDMVQEGDFADTSFESVKSYLSGCENINMYKGLFPETAGPVQDRQFSFVYIDVDMYQSVKDCCNFFYRRVVPGGIMLFDDYGFLTCKGAKLAVDEFFAAKKEVPIYLPTGQCLAIKL